MYSYFFTVNLIKVSCLIYSNLKYATLFFKDMPEVNERLVLWFNFILGLNFIILCFKLIIIHHHTQKQREIKFQPRIKLNQNIQT